MAAPKNTLSLFLTKEKSIEGRNVWHGGQQPQTCSVCLKANWHWFFWMKEKESRQKPKRWLRNSATENEKKEERVWWWEKILRLRLGLMHENLTPQRSRKVCALTCQSLVRRDSGEMWDVIFFVILIMRHAPGPWRGPSYVSHLCLANLPNIWVHFSRSLKTLKKMPFWGQFSRSFDLSRFGCVLWRTGWRFFIYIHIRFCTYNGLTVAEVRAPC